ncbi:pyrroloquinoline quinone biosynthesis peptide chaperone PqqD [Marinobacter sp. HL-58]|uniref:pyrroloquinoline quinone biosynthesis peptide chaperone PqqD n=1 Tax=Marinobacter sp. HL-58 TaxID=1479237 RepID=UPI00048568A4|nr:pyrroloquinoline quinone biosynthesis peptide chaperone PqqD [Marinobacter sp. HL-58]KPQ03041.1 MAG: pyrroloquinoline quinone biosynthesis protein PqqD [Marinobacter sp. HL-58]
MAMSMEQVPRLRPGFRFQWEPAQNAHVLLYPEGMVRLNDSAGAVLKEVNGERSVADIVTRLEQQFPDAGSLENDVSDFLKDAEQQHWILFT